MLLQYLPLAKSSAHAYGEALRAGLENTRPVPLSDEFPVLSEVTVSDSEHDGETLAEARVRERFGVTVVAVSSPAGEVLVNPPAATTIRSGDKLRIFGLPKQIAEFAAYVRADRQSH